MAAHSHWVKIDRALDHIKALDASNVDPDGTHIITVKRQPRSARPQAVPPFPREWSAVHHRNGDRADNRTENLELWVTGHRSGQRVVDVIEALARDYPDSFHEVALRHLSRTRAESVV